MIYQKRTGRRSTMSRLLAVKEAANCNTERDRKDNNADVNLTRIHYGIHALPSDLSVITVFQIPLVTTQR